MKEDGFSLVIVIVSILVIIMSLINFNVRITGDAVDSGTINLTIEEYVSINFTSFNISFGKGAVDPGQTNATIDTLGNIINGNWTNVTQGLSLENFGVLNVSVELNFDRNASSFIGGTNPSYLYNVTNREDNSCIDSGSFNLGEWYEVDSSNSVQVCDNLGYINSNDSLDIDIRLNIPVDSQKGFKQSYVTATATVVV